MDLKAGDKVRCLQDRPALDLPAGTPGAAETIYDTDPKAWEVTFIRPNGKAIDLLVYQEDIEPIDDSTAPAD